jgi:hypothetical protein
VGPHHGAMHIPPNGGSPWRVACVDVVHLEKTESGMSKAVVFSDRFGRGMRAFPCTAELDAKEFINIVTFGLIPDVGRPEVMVSDRGSNLIASLCMAYYDAFGIEARPTDAHMHTGVGLTERFNATLREMARAAYFDSKRQWDLYLPYIVMFYNATVQESTGFSPYFIEHGREPSLPWHLVGGNQQVASTVPEYVRKHLLALHLAWDVCARNLEVTEKQRKQIHDQKYQTNISFSPGDRVLLLQPGRQDKMSMPYVGPYRVVQGPDERDRYQLRDLEGRRFNYFHVSKLKLWPDSEDIDDEYYVVEKVVDAATHADGVRRYRIKWRGWAAKHNTWEELGNLNSAAREEALAWDREHSTVVSTKKDGNVADADAAAAGGARNQGGATATRTSARTGQTARHASPEAPESVTEAARQQARDSELRARRAADRAAAREKAAAASDVGNRGIADTTRTSTRDGGASWEASGEAADASQRVARRLAENSEPRAHRATERAAARGDVAVVTEVGNQETGRAASAASTTKATPAWTIAGLADAMRRMAW